HQPALSEQSGRYIRQGYKGSRTRSVRLGQGVCVGDYDNDGFDDLFVTYYGQNHLYRNNGKSDFVDVTEAAGLKQETRWSTGCAFLDYDLDGKVDLFIANYVVFDKERIPLPGASPDCRW